MQKMKNKNDAEIKKIRRDAGNFAGFVLLKEAKFDKAKFFSDLKNDWGIDVAEQDNNEDDGLVYVEAENNRIVVGLIGAPVPNGEAENFASVNYMWRRAADEVSKHTAHIILAILGGESDIREKAKLYVKTACSLLKQEGVIALYSEGAVYQPKMFLECAECMRENQLPLLNLIWYGLYNNGRIAGFYTYGMRRLGFNEMEIYTNVKKADVEKIRELIVNISAYVLDTGTVFRDGETIGYSEKMKLPITVNKGIAVNGDTIKIHID